MNRNFFQLVTAPGAVRRGAFCLALLLTLTQASAAPVYPAAPAGGEGENLIKTGDFGTTLDGWGLYLEGGRAEIAVNDAGEMELRIESTGKVDYGVQDYYDGFSLEEGCEYRLDFDVRSDLEREITWRVQLNGGDYHAYAMNTVLVGPAEQHVSETFTMQEPTDPAPRFCFNCGVSEGYTDGDPAHVITFDNVCLQMTDRSGAAAASPEEEACGITLNQVGYLPDSVKNAVLRGAEGGDGLSFSVVRSGTGETVLEKAAGERRVNEVSGETLRVLDFSEITEPGSYELRAGEASAVFGIGEDVLDPLAEGVLHFYEIQKCGEALEAGKYSHGACHTSEASVYENPEETRDVTGGWHDAGDYGRYTVPAAKACADLLLAFEDFGGAGSFARIPDLVRYELEWLLKMQDDDGGVHHKVTCGTFPGAVPPDEETDRLILCPVSAAATGDFAAVMAIAARVLRDGEPDGEAFADACLDAALRAEKWLSSHPSDGTGFLNPDGIVTGEYGDAADTDERFWAEAELLRTTGEDGGAERLLDALTGADLGWTDVTGYGLYAAVRGCGPDTELFREASARLSEAAETALDKSRGDGYGAALGADDYVWGSNMVAANRGMLFLMAGRVTGKEAYRDAAWKQLNYLLGNNTNGICYVSGFGTTSPEHPHHRPSQAAGEAVPGMLAGGPDGQLEDPYARNVLSGRAPAACYADSDQSYSTNEVAIYWNSPLVYLLAGVAA